MLFESLLVIDPSVTSKENMVVHRWRETSHHQQEKQWLGSYTQQSHHSHSIIKVSNSKTEDDQLNALVLRILFSLVKPGFSIESTSEDF